ncbi:MAG: sugar ABC transporter permease [Epulopiscium sp.]|mgnify:CR=1 FL=1|nr:sugar ABC transporter permease [Candidatus Epulonipiscium sp.]
MEEKIKSLDNKYLKNHWQLYVMLIVPLIHLIIFKYLPMVGTMVAFKDYNIFQGIWKSDWIGFTHFKEAFASKEFWIAIKNTLILNLGDLLIGFPIPIILAIFLNELNGEKVKKTSQVIMYLPHFLSWVIIAGIVQQVFSNNGLINQLLIKLGGKSVPFLSNPGIWRMVYWITGIWQSAGYGLIIYLAALTSIDPSLYEAAYIDGAGRFRRIWYITLPQLRPTISIMLIMNLGKIMSISFDRPYLLGNVLVKDTANVISTHVYTLGLQSGRFDFATAIGLFQSVIGVILILIVNQLAQKFGEEGIL